MGEYLLTGIDKDQWKLFKASCALQGVTVKQALLKHIDTVVMIFKLRRGPSSNINQVEEKGDDES